MYAYGIGLGGSYGHEFDTITVPELVHFDGILIKDGVKGGSGGALYRRWQACSDLDENIDLLRLLGH